MQIYKGESWSEWKLEICKNWPKLQLKAELSEKGVWKGFDPDTVSSELAQCYHPRHNDNNMRTWFGKTNPPSSPQQTKPIRPSSPQQTANTEEHDIVTLSAWLETGMILFLVSSSHTLVISQILVELKQTEYSKNGALAGFEYSQEYLKLNFVGVFLL